MHPVSAYLLGDLDVGWSKVFNFIESFLIFAYENLLNTKHFFFKLFLFFCFVKKLLFILPCLTEVEFLELSGKVSFAACELVFGLIRKAFQLINASFLQDFLPILIFPDSFKKFHETYFVADLRGFVIVAILPVDFPDLVFDVVRTESEYALL